MDSSKKIAKSLKSSALATLKNPLAYFSSLSIGLTFSYLEPGSLHTAIPFAAPLVVSWLWELMRNARSVTTASADARGGVPVLNIVKMQDICMHQFRSGEGCLLLKISINAAKEVVRLTSEEGVIAEERLCNMLEKRIQEYFKGCIILKIEYHSFYVITGGCYGSLSEYIKEFSRQHSPWEVTLGGITYFPKLMIGCTTLCDSFADTFSRLEFAAKKAGLTSELSMAYIDHEDKEYLSFRKNRTGLRKVRRAIAEQEIGVFAQPIVPLTPGKEELPRVEILCRRYTSDGRIESPMEIIELANFNEIFQDLDIYIFRLVCKNFKRIFGEQGERVAAVSLNICGMSYSTPHFAEKLNDIVEHYGVPKHKLILEVTEHVTTESLEAAKETMMSFRAMGFTLALDDIGMGSSNFHNLRTLPVDYFKLDRSYVLDICRDKISRDFVKIVIDLAKETNRIVVAEGIPDEYTMEILKEMGVDFSQSFITGRPYELICAPKYKDRKKLNDKNEAA